MLTIMKGAEPFFFPGGKTGALCVHGLTATPQEVYWLGKSLAERGLTVYGPRLAGHGTRFEEMYRSHWEDWYYSVLDGYHVLRQCCERVVVMGMSLGGLLSLHLAAHEDIAGLVVIAAPLYLANRTVSLAPVLRHVVKTVSTFDRSTDPMNERVMRLQRERGEPVVGRVAYYRHSAAGLAELLKVQQVVLPELARITAPTLLVYSEKDSAVPFGNVDVLTNGLIATPSVAVVRLTQSDHIIPNDVECDLLFDHAWAFVRKITAAPRDTRPTA
jgi:carboxylesterase